MPEITDNPIYQEKTVTPSKSTQTITADSDYNGLSKVIVNANPNDYVQPSGTFSINENGAYDIKNYAYVNVDISSTDTGLGGPSSGSSISSLPTVGESGLVTSTAEGLVIYTILSQSGESLSTVSNRLMYASYPKDYRAPLEKMLLEHTPVIVLTSGTVTMPTAVGYTIDTIASGTGYYVYRYRPSQA